MSIIALQSPPHLLKVSVLHLKDSGNNAYIEECNADVSKLFALDVY